MKDKKNSLPGKIAVQTSDHICSIYENSDTVISNFNIRNDKEVHYGGFTWLNLRDAFVGSEFISGASREDYKGNIVVFDLNGKIIDRIYEAQKGEIAGLAYPSRSDNYLLFTQQRVGDLNLNPIEGLMRMNSIVIMDLQKKQIIKNLENVGRSPNFIINESPWVYDEKRFLYSISNENKIVFQSKDVTSVKEDSAGVYIYDLRTNQKKLLVSGGRYGVGSPTDLEIAYVKDQSVWTMNLKDNSKKMIYIGGQNEKIRDVHWSPDGKYIYLAFFNSSVLNLFYTSGEKLIETSTKKEISFKQIGHGFGTYTWK